MPGERDSLPRFESDNYVALPRDHWWLLVLIPLAIAAATYWVTPSKAAGYSASVTLFVNQSATPGSQDPSAIARLASGSMDQHLRW